MVDDAKEIVGKLTKGQKRAIVAMTDRWQRPSRDTFSHGAAWGCHWKFDKKLVDRCRMGATQDRAYDAFRLLPLGIEVRALLHKEQCDG